MSELASDQSTVLLPGPHNSPIWILRDQQNNTIKINRSSSRARDHRIACFIEYLIQFKCSFWPIELHSCAITKQSMTNSINTCHTSRIEEPSSLILYYINSHKIMSMMTMMISKCSPGEYIRIVLQGKCNCNLIRSKFK